MAMDFTKIEKYNPGVSEADARMKLKAMELELPTNLELDAIRDDKQFDDFRPCRSATHMKYKSGATEALVWNEGEKKKTKISLPLNDGWYKTEKKYGIPNGAPSNRVDPEARYLWRYQNSAFSGLLVRGGDWLNGGDGRRGVYPDGRPSVRLGVLGVRRKPHMHKWKMVCDCGEEKKVR